jgi:hypothetical protein
MVWSSQFCAVLTIQPAFSVVTSWLVLVRQHPVRCASCPHCTLPSFMGRDSTKAQHHPSGSDRVSPTFTSVRTPSLISTRRGVGPFGCRGRKRLTPEGGLAAPSWFLATRVLLPSGSCSTNASVPDEGLLHHHQADTLLVFPSSKVHHRLSVF